MVEIFESGGGSKKVVGGQYFGKIVGVYGGGRG